MSEPPRGSLDLDPQPTEIASRRAFGDLVATVAGLLVYLGLVAVANRWGEALLARGVRLQIQTPPLNGVLDWRPGRSAGWVIVAAVVVVAIGPTIAGRMSWAGTLVVAWGSSIGWAVALALVDGRSALTQPLLSDQYLRTAQQIGDLSTFLHTFVARIATYNIHTQGHPPGMVVVLWLMDRAGLGGVGWNAALVFAGGAAAVVATLVAVRDVAGEATARRAAPFVVLAPAAVAWTSGDPFFAGVSAWAVTALVLATSRSGRSSRTLSVVGGVLFACTAFLSYGLVLLGIVPVVVAGRRRRLDVVAIAATVAVVVVLLVWAGTGFAWWDGLAATRARYFAGAGGRRPYSYFLVANLAAFAVAVGPATAVAVARLRRSPLALLVGATIAVVLLADLSGLSKAEVERIWLPFVPWVMASGAVLAGRRRTARFWLAVQGADAVLLAVAIRSPW